MKIEDLDALLEIYREISDKGITVQAQLKGLETLIPKIEGFTSQDYYKLFEENCETGGATFLWDWLKANENAIEVARQFGLDVEQPVIKAFLTSLVLKILQKNLGIIK